MDTIPKQVMIGDRLGSTLFLAALAHGVVILGVTFTVGSIDNAEVLPSLNVTLIVDRDDMQAAPETSEFLAQRNQSASGGIAEGSRPTTVLSAEHPLTQTGDPEGADLTDGTPQEQASSAEQLVTNSSADDRSLTLPQSTDTSAAMPMKAAALLDQQSPETLATELDVRAEMPEAANRELVATPSTRESELAPYLDNWRRRVERIGTANFPAKLLGNQAQQRPTLEVVIGSDGHLEDIVVRRSSGDSALDQAALTILRMAAPFEPLPDNIRARYDVLRFAYEWDFLGGEP